jgi:hypothetical protein
MTYTVHPSLTKEQILSRLSVDCATGVCVWVNPSKYHPGLIGKVAGSVIRTHAGKAYWVIKLDGRAYRRSRLVLMIATGVWPPECVDHKNGDSLDDRATNLRQASDTENNWNHQKRKKESPLPMGVRGLKSGRFQARIACGKRTHNLGTFKSAQEARDAYLVKRSELFGEFA